jgi:hypothetical protein
MSFEPMKRILSRAVQRAGLETQVSAARIVSEAEEALIRLWGTERASYVSVVSAREGVLKVRVLSPAAAQTLKKDEVAWMNEVNRAMGERRIHRIALVREGF